MEEMNEKTEIRRLQFEGYKVSKIEYLRDASIESNQNISLESQLQIGSDGDDATITLTVECFEDSVSVKVSIIGYYRFIGIDDVDLKREILQLNGTAILYPYLRSTVSMVSCIDSPEAILLPTINVTNLYNDK